MNPATVLAALNGALELSRVLLPVVQEMRSSGQITPEQQAELRTKVDALKSEAAFAGPEWEKSGR